MTKQYFVLDKGERKQEWIMLSFLALFFITILTGLYTQVHNMDFDYILVPALIISGGCFYAMNGWNAFGKGSLVMKYIPFYLPLFSKFNLKKWFSFSPEEAHRVSVLSFGILSLLVGAIRLFPAAITIVRGV